MVSERTVKITHSAKVEVSYPADAARIKEFAEALPDHATVTITTRMGGTQRDPEPVGYVLVGQWFND